MEVGQPLKFDFFWDLDIYYLRIEIILIVQNCSHIFNTII